MPRPAVPIPSSARPDSADAPGRARQAWPEASLPLAEQLLEQLRINDRDWHALKAQRSRRAAEQLAAALVQLLKRDQPGGAGDPAARLAAAELADHAVRWLRQEISDPGCPSHGR
ncbi:MAG: DUF6439 family protein [Synechococcaceae cyanobacterium]|nr:DUF6439 family protein [Synechococcaceae cyanobacterium]